MKRLTIYRWSLFSSLCCILLLAGTARISQGQKINKNHPSVYLTFKEFVKKTAGEAHPSQGARLVLHNNTRWPIYYGKWFDPSLPGDMPVIYNIELENGCFDVRMHVDVVTNGKLMPGKTVNFVVPREDFSKGSKIHVGFNFSWEIDPGVLIPVETVHRAYFYSSDLPAWP